ncbi:tetratricopeptide repeat protein, partial [Gemmatimonadota bacterium]
PGDPEALNWIAVVERRLGNWDATRVAHEEALKRDPMSSGTLAYASLTARWARDYDLGYRVATRMAELGEPPAWPALRLTLMRKQLGDLAVLRAWVDSVGPALTPSQATQLNAEMAYYGRDYPAALAFTREWSSSSHWRLGTICRLARDLECQRAYGDSIRMTSEASIERLEGSPILRPRRRRALLMGILARGYALRGDRDSAISWGRRAVEAYPPAFDVYQGTAVLSYLRDVYVLVGDTENAVRLLDELLSRPSLTALNDLKLDPFYDSMRSDLGFQALLERHGGESPNPHN